MTRPQRTQGISSNGVNGCPEIRSKTVSKKLIKKGGRMEKGKFFVPNQDSIAKTSEDNSEVSQAIKSRPLWLDPQDEQKNSALPAEQKLCPLDDEHRLW
jgi:hypothetical protein